MCVIYLDSPPPLWLTKSQLGTDSRSTVGTATDVSPLLRLTFSRVGLPSAGYSSAFSFNDSSGMCPESQGSGEVFDIDESELIDMQKSIDDGAFNFQAYQKSLSLSRECNR
ncbi:hypothetical protein HH682_05000 [Rosenbergiella sp. S61]|uniref:UvrABC system protein A n=1 Tax=Rosenbergiella gaditana TaxID=2726987 RepID=A0ABS5SYF7_9GAMM|nr:hypothetical protein [Rosenbergiella gaditana]MBT0723808.1 hypothetical protein [Rosenbergiella gaditana]